MPGILSRRGGRYSACIDIRPQPPLHCISNPSLSLSLLRPPGEREVVVSLLVCTGAVGGSDGAVACSRPPVRGLRPPVAPSPPNLLPAHLSASSPAAATVGGWHPGACEPFHCQHLSLESPDNNRTQILPAPYFWFGGAGSPQRWPPGGGGGSLFRDYCQSSLVALLSGHGLPEGAGEGAAVA